MNNIFLFSFWWQNQSSYEAMQHNDRQHITVHESNRLSRWNEDCIIKYSLLKHKNLFVRFVFLKNTTTFNFRTPCQWNVFSQQFQSNNHNKLNSLLQWLQFPKRDNLHVPSVNGRECAITIPALNATDQSTQHETNEKINVECIYVYMWPMNTFLFIL